tara:strand:- start:1188 stop:1574 length:387 start_codon:yes stop_codon:yes gene_type:complete
MSEAIKIAVKELNDMLGYFENAYKWHNLHNSFIFNKEEVKEVQIAFSKTFEDLIELIDADEQNEGEYKSEYLIRVLEDDKIANIKEAKEARNRVVKLHRYSGLKALSFMFADAPTKRVIRNVSKMSLK